MKILAVDDKPDNLELLVQILEDYEVITAASGREGITSVKEFMPDLIILDVQMPEMNGYEVLEQLQSDDATKDIPVIFLSARFRDSDRIIKGLELGAFDYITKPVDDEILLAKVGTVARIITAEEKLKKSEAELKKHTDNLELLVQERTMALEAVQAELVQKEKLAMIGKMTASVAHELRNPLGTVRGSTYLLKEYWQEIDRTKSEAMFERIERNTMRCGSIIDQLLDFSRSSPLKLEETNIDSWANRILAGLTSPEAVRISWELNSGAKILIDRQRMRQALLNVLSNSCEAITNSSVFSTEAGSDVSGLVSVHTKMSKNRLEISTTDTGSGILPENNEAISQPFFSTKSFGVGLGLATVKETMRLHGGGMEFESKPGKGSTFVLWFPLKDSS